MNCEFPLPRQAAPTVPFKPRTGSPVVTGTGRIVLPPHGPGMRIGLFGGTFDPVHAAHRAACLLAMKRLGLDRVWWLVTPGNPLKDTRGLAPLAERVHAAQVLAHHPRIDVTDLETQLGTRYTHQTIAYLRQGCPGVRFVWIMGADNLRSFHRWQRWRGIAALVPIAVVDRLGPALPPWPQVAAVLYGAARGTSLAKRLKLLTARAYLSSAPDFETTRGCEGAEGKRKEKDPCPHLQLVGPNVARPNRSPECVLTLRRSSVWSSPASTI